MRFRSAPKTLLALLAPLLLAIACAASPIPAASAPMAIDPPSSPDWTRDMARFAEDDAAHPPPRHPVVFTGSSSVRLWDTLASDFAGVPVLNRGFGGSQMRDAVWYADQIAIRYQPERIVIYSGDNDISAGRTPQQVAADFRAFVARIRRALPKTPIAFIAIKPSPSRASMLAAQREANALVKADIAKMTHVEYIDVFTPMLDGGGQPRAELFGEDRLHMNRKGYALWRRTVFPFVRPGARP